jgi:hypothetical protein
MPLRSTASDEVYYLLVKQIPNRWFYLALPFSHRHNRSHQECRKRCGDWQAPGEPIVCVYLRSY